MNIVFVTYIARSGSTFLLNELSKFQEVFVCPEAEILIFYFFRQKEFRYNKKVQRHLEFYISRDKKLKNWGLIINDLEDLHHVNTYYEAFIKILEIYKNKLKPEATTIVFKAEIFFNYFEDIPDEFKKKYNLQLISLLRDCRAIFASQKHSIGGFSGKVMNNNPLRTAKRFNYFIRKSTEYKKYSNFYILKYEDLIQHYPASVHDLLTRLGIKFTAIPKSKGDLFNRIPKAQHKMHLNILRDADKNRVNIWQNELNPVEITVLEERCKNSMNKMKYSISGRKDNFFFINLIIIYYKFNFLNGLIIQRSKRILKKVYYLVIHRIRIVH